MSYSTLYDELTFSSGQLKNIDCSSISALTLIKYCVDRSYCSLEKLIKPLLTEELFNIEKESMNIKLSIFESSFLYNLIPFTPINFVHMDKTEDTVKLYFHIKRKNHLGNNVDVRIFVNIDEKYMRDISNIIDYLNIKKMFVQNQNSEMFIIPSCVKTLLLKNCSIKYIINNAKKLKSLTLEHVYPFASGNKHTAEEKLIEFLKYSPKLQSLTVSLEKESSEKLLNYLINNNSITYLIMYTRTQKQEIMNLFTQLLEKNKIIKKLSIVYSNFKENKHPPLNITSISSNFKNLFLDIDISYQSVEKLISFELNENKKIFVNVNWQLSIDNFYDLLTQYPNSQLVCESIKLFLLKQTVDSYKNLSQTHINKINHLFDHCHSDNTTTLAKKIFLQAINN